MKQKLPIGCLTRSWSVYYCSLKAFLNSFDDIKNIIKNKSLVMPTNKNLIEILKIFFQILKQFFNKLQIINMSSIHYVILKSIQLKTILKPKLIKESIPKRMKRFGQIFLNLIDKKYLFSISNAHIISLFLHPNYKSFTLSNILKNTKINNNYDFIAKIIENYFLYLKKTHIFLFKNTENTNNKELFIEFLDNNQNYINDKLVIGYPVAHKINALLNVLLFRI